MYLWSNFGKHKQWAEPQVVLHSRVAVQNQGSAPHLALCGILDGFLNEVLKQQTKCNLPKKHHDFSKKSRSFSNRNRDLLLKQIW